MARRQERLLLLAAEALCHSAGPLFKLSEFLYPHFREEREGQLIPRRFRLSRTPSRAGRNCHLPLLELRCNPKLRHALDIDNGIELVFQTLCRVLAQAFSGAEVRRGSPAPAGLRPPRRLLRS
jgi:hypothetical protein